MSFSNITQEDLVNRGVTGLPDTPNLSTADMQRKFDELSLDVVIPKFNKLLEDLVSATAAANIGAKAPEGMTGETVQALLDSFYTVVQACETAKHGHENIEVLDAMTADIYTNIDHIIALLGDITNITDTVTGSSTEIPTGKAIAEYIQVLGGGDMLKSIYDPDGDGIVKGADVATNAEKLGGQLPGYYQPVTADELETAAKTIVGAINEVNAKIDNAEVDTLTTMEQVEAATDSSIPVGAGAIKELNESLANVSKNVYSTDEKVIGTWIDGKPLYRKVIEFSSFASGSMVDHNIPNIDHVHLGVGTCGTRSDGWILSNYFVNIAGADYLVQIVNKTQFHASYSGTYSKFIFVVEYTKTTD